MKTHRLLPDTPGSWARYEDFENRIRAFCRKYLPETPEVSLLAELRRKWVTAPLSTGYWIGYGDSGNPAAHLCSYISARFDLPFVEFCQVEFDAGESILGVLPQIGGEIAEWVSRLNRIYEAAGQRTRITSGESMTWIDPKIYERLFRGLGFGLKASRTVFRWDLTGVAETTGQPDGGLALPRLVS